MIDRIKKLTDCIKAMAKVRKWAKITNAKGIKFNLNYIHSVLLPGTFNPSKYDLHDI